MSYRELIGGFVANQIDKFLGNDSGNAPVMLMLGGFKFSINTAVFQEVRRKQAWRWEAQKLFAQRDALQFTGNDAETVELPGVIFPDWRGGVAQLDDLRSLADQGQPLKLISAAGDVLGDWVIESIEETAAMFKPDGTPRKIEFTVQLRNFA